MSRVEAGNETATQGRGKALEEGQKSRDARQEVIGAIVPNIYAPLDTLIDFERYYKDCGIMEFTIISLKILGFKQREIASKLECCQATVSKKLKKIRKSVII